MTMVVEYQGSHLIEKIKQDMALTVKRFVQPKEKRYTSSTIKLLVVIKQSHKALATLAQCIWPTTFQLGNRFFRFLFSNKKILF